jgi:deazaflavin-dependent oxidoreductase (nitroreductase family)
MRIPEPLFVIVNFVVRLLLKSPLHFLMSNSVLLISYIGRKSGAVYSTPVRYIRAGSCFRCFTSENVQWWRNVQANPAVSLVVRGTKSTYTAIVLEQDPDQVRQLLSEFLVVYPQDAVYQDIRLNSDGSLNSDDLAKASHRAIIVEFVEALYEGDT